MSDSEPSDVAPSTADAPRRLPTAALLALLIALGTAAFVGYRGWRDQGVGTRVQAALDDRLAALASLERRVDEELAALAGDVEALRRDAERAESARSKLQDWQTQREQAATAETEAAATAETEAAATAETEAAATPAPAQAWQVAEAEYLLRVANHRLRLEADASGALGMLAAADQALAAADPFAYHDVRARLARERAALEAVAGTDVQGIYLRLAALMGQLDELPLRAPAYIAKAADTDPQQAQAEATALDAILGRLAGLVRFRSAGPPVRPLLPPEQAEYLLLNLRLALNHAQLAALRRDQAVFGASLATASEWLSAHVDLRADAGRAFAAALAALQEEDLAATLPDISGSLARLRALRSPPQENGG